MERLAGRVALITGAASGIGKATAERLAAEGAEVMVTDVDDGSGKTVASELAYRGKRASYLHLDVVSESEWRQAVAGITEQFGKLDILVNNAGVRGEPGSIEETSLADWDRSIAIMQTGVFLGLKHAAALLSSRHAAVVNISSIFGASGGFGTSPAYHAAKGAVRILTKTAALRWARKGIRVNSIHPGFIDTPLLVPESAGIEPQSGKFHQAVLSSTPMGRLGRPEEVAAGVAYLASDDASFVTGAELYIDGGYMAR